VSLKLARQINLGIVVRRHLMTLAAFLMQPQSPALAVLQVSLDLHGDHRVKVRESIHHNIDFPKMFRAPLGRLGAERFTVARH
jgi:hypothetical protein